MPYDIPLPDGRIITDVPDDVGQAQAIDGFFEAQRPDIGARARDAQRAVFDDLSMGEKAIVGFRGATRSLAAGLLGSFDAGRQAVRDFEARERSGIEVAGESLGPQTITEAIPNMAASARMLPGAIFEGVVEGLQAPPGQGVERALQGAGESVVGNVAFRTAANTINLAWSGAKQAGRALTRDPVQPTVVTDIDLIRSGTTPYDRLAATAQEVGEGFADEVPTSQAERLRLVAQADRLGIRVTPGQRFGNQARQQVEASMASFPPTSAPFAELAEGNSVRYAQLLNRAIGENGDAVTPITLGRATERLGRTFRDVAGRLEAPFQNSKRTGAFAEFLNAVQEAGSAARQDIRNATPIRFEDLVVGVEQAPSPVSNLADVLEFQSGEPSFGVGDLMSVRSSLVDEISQLTSGRGNAVRGSEVRSLGDMVNAIDNLLVSAGEEAGGDAVEAAGEYAVARTQWRLLQAIQNPGSINQLGEVSAKRLNNVLNREYPGEYRRGGLTGVAPGRSYAGQAMSDFMDATRVGATVSQDIVGNSGTPTRLYLQNLAQSPESIVGVGLRYAGGNEVGRAALAIPSSSGGVSPDAASRVGAAFGGSEQPGGESVDEKLQRQTATMLERLGF